MNSNNSENIFEYINNLEILEPPNICKRCHNSIFMCDNCKSQSDKLKIAELAELTELNIIINKNIQQIDWTIIKTPHIVFTNEQYEYACFNSFFALKYIPLEKQTIRMLKLAFRPKYETLKHDQCGSFGKYKIKCDYDNAYIENGDSKSILTYINPDLLSFKDICEYIYSNGHVGAFESYYTTGMSDKSNDILSHYVDLAINNEAINNSNTDNYVFDEDMPKIENFIMLHNVKTLVDIPDELISFESVLMILHWDWSDLNQIMEITKKYNFTDEEFQILKISKIIIDKTFDVNALNNYSHMITKELLHKIITTHGNCHFISYNRKKCDCNKILLRCLKYLKANISLYDPNILYELTMSSLTPIRAWLNFECYFSQISKNRFSLFRSNEQFFTFNQELEIIKNKISDEPALLFYICDYKNFNPLNDKIFLELFEIAKTGPNFSTKYILPEMRNYPEIIDLCRKLVMIDPNNLWYLTEYNNNLNLELDQLEDFYRKLLTKKTFYVFLLTKKYRTFEMYNISIDTYISKLKNGEYSNLYFYEEEDNEWFVSADWLKFFTNHNNLTNKELWLLSRKLVNANGLFLRHIDLRELVEPYKSDIISIALEQNGMALLFCEQNYERCLIAVKSNPAVYEHVKNQFKTELLINTAIEQTILNATN